jgi:glycosyltransferase involved in cell wall biosynthesis
MDGMTQYSKDVSNGPLGTVTIVVVCYDESPERIAYTFESILNQNYPHKELIVIDGGSKSDTLEAIQSYCSSLTYFVSEPDNGIYDAMNKGLQIANGEWVAFMNIGDRFHSNGIINLMLQEENLRDNPDLLYGDANLTDKSRADRHERIPKTIGRWFLYRGTICHQAMLIRKRAFEKIGQFDTSYKVLADKDWLFKFLGNGLLARHCKIVVCDWDLKGLTSSVTLFKEEWDNVVRKRFSKFEQLLYGLLWFFLKIAKRTRTLNFSIPHGLLKAYDARQAHGPTKKDIEGISIIVATLGEHDLIPLLNSLETQTCDKYECIIVDQSQERKAERIVSNFRNARYVHSTKEGNSLNRNIGVSYSRFPILAFPDDDCFYSQDVVERVLRTFELRPALAGISGTWFDSISGRMVMGGKHGKLATRFNVWSSMTNLTIFLRKEVVCSVNGYSERFGLGSGIFEGGEETDLMLKIFKRGGKILYAPQIRIWHRQENYTLTNPEKQWGYEEAWGALFRKWSAEKNGSIIYCAFIFFFLRSVCASIVWALRGNLKNARFYISKNKARLQGWRSYRQNG